MPRRILTLLTSIGALAAVVGPTSGGVGAHVSAIGYGHIRLHGDSVTWSLLLDPWHLETFMSLDVDNDAEITSEEVTDRADEIVELIVPNLRAVDQSDVTDGVPTVGALRIVSMETTELRGEGFTDLMDFPLVEVPVEFTFPRAVEPRNLVVSYGLFLQSGFGDHWNTTRIEYGDGSYTVRFTADQPAFSQETARANALTTGSLTPDAPAEQPAPAPASTTGHERAGIGVPAVLFVVAGVALAAVLSLLQRRRGQAAPAARHSKPTSPAPPNRRSTTVGTPSRSQR